MQMLSLSPVVNGHVIQAGRNVQACEISPTFQSIDEES